MTKLCEKCGRRLGLPCSFADCPLYEVKDDASVRNITNRNMPGATITSLSSGGVSADRAEAVLIVNTKEQGEIALKIRIDTALSRMIDVMLALRQQTRDPDDALEAHPVECFSIGSVKDDKIRGALLSIEPKTNNEQSFIFDPQSAISAGQLLMRIGGQLAPRDKASAIINPGGSKRLFDKNGQPITGRKN